MYYGVSTFSKDIFNGVTGVVTDPIKGGRKDGFKGAAKGLGKGILGLIFKPIAGTCSLVSYTT